MVAEGVVTAHNVNNVSLVRPQCSHMVTEGVVTVHNVNNVNLVREIKVHSLGECRLLVGLF